MKRIEKLKNHDYSKEIKRLGKFGRWMLSPGLPVTLTLVLLSAVLLSLIFANGWDETLLAYITYPLSAWALTAGIMAVIPAGMRIRAWFFGSAKTRYIRDPKIRESLSMLSGLLISLFYAVFKLTTGCIYRSAWLIAVAIYYAVLAVTRYLLLKKRNVRGADAWHAYRITGALMILLSLTISGMAVQMVRDNQAYSYPGLIIYASAAYTFYSLAMAIVQLIRYRKTNSPMLLAARTLTFAVALMALFALQTGLIDQFGTAENAAFRMTMNALTGSFVCLTTLVCGCRMLLDRSNAAKE